MQVIVDANVLISMLIKPGKPVDLLLVEELQLFSPQLLFTEIENNKDAILKKSRLTQKEINQFLLILKNKITIIPEEDFLKYKSKAETICPDPKDLVYFALALHLHCPLWSNEKQLKDQDHIRIFATHELIELFNLN